MTDKDLEIQKLRRELAESQKERFKAQEQAVYYRRQVDFLMETANLSIVRCRECQQMSIEPDGVRWCDHFSVCVEDDSFCSYGKRKSNG